MKKITDLIAELDYVTTHMVEVGILAEDKDTKGSDGKTTILKYAVYNEFGTKHIPPRPFMRHAIETYGEEIGAFIDKRMEDVVDGKISGRHALMRIGLFIMGRIQLSIQTATFWAEPLSEKTMKQKLKRGEKNNKTLIEDGLLLRSIRFQITSKSGKAEYISKAVEIRR